MVIKQTDCETAQMITTRSDHPMKVFIIGPEGAGKTVFAAMMSRYCAQDASSPLKFRASDAATKVLLARELTRLDEGEWPDSTAMGRLPTLRWEWGVTTGNTVSWCGTTLIDPPGQDVRRELAGDSTELGIVKEIEQADLLILIVDLVGHQRDSAPKRTINEWIVELTLKRAEGTQRDLLVLVSKADLLDTQIAPNQWAQRQPVVDLIQRLMPECNLRGYENLLHSSQSNVLCFSSVATKNTEEANGTLLRQPLVPVQSAGMLPVLAAIARAITAHAARSAREVATQLAQERATKRAAAVRGTLATVRRYVPALLIVAAIGGFIYSIRWWPRSPQLPQRIDCPDCVGGQLAPYFWIRIPGLDYDCGTCGADGTLND